MIRPPLVALAVFLIGLDGGISAAQTNTFMRVPGINVSSTAERYKDAIDVVSLRQSWTAGKTTACQIEVVKGLDIAGPLLWAAAVTGQVFGEIVVDVTKTVGDQARFFQLKLNNAQIAGIVTSPSTLGETVALSAQTATLTFWPQRIDGELGPPVTSTVACVK